MQSIRGKRLPTDLLESHRYMCDLMYLEFSVVALYSDGKQNWIYLWCDTNSLDKHRWLVFTVSRKILIDYLEKRVNLFSAVKSARQLWMLEERVQEAPNDKLQKKKQQQKRSLFEVSSSAVEKYLPTEASYFDEALAPDLDLTKQLIPTVYDVPISGIWFGRDFEYLFKRYERIYAFFYATQPRFIRTVNENLEKLLRTPWMGGASRVHLYSRLAEVIPGIHSLKVEKLQFASPGEVEFEAIHSIGQSIERTTLAYLENEEVIEAAHKRIKDTLTAARLNKQDLSQRSDQSIVLSEGQWNVIKVACAEIATVLNINAELESLRVHSPNTVVYAKAVNSFVRQVMRLAKFQRDEMLNFGEESKR